MILMVALVAMFFTGVLAGVLLTIAALAMSHARAERTLAQAARRAREDAYQSYAVAFGPHTGH